MTGAARSGSTLYRWGTWKENICNRNLWLCAGALTAVLLLTTLLNNAAFPYYDTVAPSARDISIAASALGSVAVALIATWRPRWLKARLISAALVVLLVTGVSLATLGVASGQALLVICGASLFSLGRIWVTIVVGVACSRLSSNRVSLCLAIAFLAAAALGIASESMSATVRLLLFYTLTPLAIIPIYRIAAPTIEKQRTSEAPGSMAITQPSSFVPFSGQMFICLFLFKVAFGYSLRFGSLDGTPATNVFTIVPVIAIAAWLLCHQRPFPADMLTRVSVLFIVGGFLSVTLVAQGFEVLSNTVIASGSQMFDMVGWAVLLSIANRNELEAVPVIAWGRSVAGIGSIVGAGIGNYVTAIFSSNSVMVFAITFALVLTFVAYALFGLKDFSFDRTIAGIVPAEDVTPVSHTTSDSVRFERRCAELATLHALTPRELEVFKMLARGRNSIYIQDELVVSRNTVKAHVKHVYAKLGVHSHQELIDLIESVTS
jgi:DNA-binding CsgD family transcriptional regulator